MKTEHSQVGAFRRKLLITCLGIIIAICAAGLRFSHLGAQSFWIDECYSSWVGSLRLEDIIDLQVNDSSPPLHYFMLHFWQRWWGKSESALRSLSALMGTGIVLVLLIFGNEIAGPWSGLMAAALAAFSPIMVYYSQETRMYSTVGLCAALSVLLLYRSLQTRNPLLTICYIIITTMGLYTQLYMIFILAAQLVFVFLPANRQHRRFGAALLGCIGFLYSPWLVVIGHQLRINSTPWIPKPAFAIIKNAVLTVCLRGWKLPFTEQQQSLLWVTVLVLGSLFVLGCRRLLQRPTWGYLLLLAWAFPGLAPLFLSLFKPMFHAGRYEQITYPFFFLIIAAGLEQLASRTRSSWLVVGLLGCILIADALALTLYFRDYRKSNDREVMKFIETHVAIREPIIFSDVCSLCYRYYGLRDHNYFTFPAGKPGWIPAPAFSEDVSYFKQQWQAIMPSVLRATPPGGSIWVARTSSLPIYQWFKAALDKTLGTPLPWLMKPGNNDVQIDVIWQYRIDDQALAFAAIQSFTP